MLQAAGVEGRFVHPVVDRLSGLASEARDQRVVGVQDDRAVLWQGREGRATTLPV